MQIYTATESAQRLSSTTPGSILLVMIDPARSADGLSLVRDKLRPLLGDEAIEMLFKRHVLIQASDKYSIEEQNAHRAAVEALLEASHKVPRIAVTAIKFSLGRVRNFMKSELGPIPHGVDLTNSSADVPLDRISGAA